ncbi:MAG: hypothetical protein KF816_06490 [Melioribacteraceae bacterium]|nr:hypothetical protein [Melioribacteraceae bacterium]
MTNSPSKVSRKVFDKTVDVLEKGADKLHISYEGLNVALAAAAVGSVILNIFLLLRKK